jgi:4,5-DOPA dioxygenase extradiol
MGCGEPVRRQIELVPGKVAYMESSHAKTMPAVFIGHGNPMNIVRRNRWTEGWAAIGASLPRPRAICAVSAHWYIPGTIVTVMEHPQTIHDFGGFPEELYEKKYPAPGDPALAAKIRDILAPLEVGRDEEWGLDHGTWSVLYHIYPMADIPVVQLSIDLTKPPAFHYEVGKSLAPLRNEGILILGSGNIVHNLRAYKWEQPDGGAYDWAVKFEDKIKGLLASGKDDRIIDYPALGREAGLSVPTPDHYLPLLYVLGARNEKDAITFPVQGFDGGSLSMLAIQIGENG